MKEMILEKKVTKPYGKRDDEGNRNEKLRPLIKKYLTQVIKCDILYLCLLLVQ